MRGWAVFILGFLLVGCSAGSRGTRPDVVAPVTPAAWMADHDAAPPAWPSQEWWHGFGSPQLDGFMAEARTANDDLAAAVARVTEADAQVKIAGAPLFPSISAGGGATRERTAVSATGGRTNFTEFDAELTASYEIDFWGKNRARRRAARELAAASRFERTTVELTVMSGVATTYFQVLGLRERLVVAQQNLAGAQKILDGLELEQRIGTVTALDVAQQQTTVAALSTLVPPLTLQLQQSLDALAILIGRAPEDLNVAPDTTLEQLIQPTIQPGLPSALLARRPDVAEAEADLRAAKADITVARAALFPSIDLTAEGGYASTALSTLINPINRIFVLSAGLVQPIFAGGALTGQLDYSKARYTELLANYHKTVISALGNVEDSLAAVQQTAEQERRQQFAAQQASRAYQIAQAQMRAGTINILTVLNTETALFTAQDALVQARFSHLQSLINLFNALGGGWQAQQPARHAQVASQSGERG